jgi:general secretion pathway protein L
MSSLIVLLPPPGAPPASEFAYALSADGRTVQEHASAPAALLPLPRGAGAEVIAVAPLQCLSWHRLELPRGMAAGSPRLRAAIEGVLEERLLDEPDALHFALQPHARAGAVWVAACDRAWLRGVLHTLEQAGRPASRAVPPRAWCPNSRRKAPGPCMRSASPTARSGSG